MIRSGPLLWLAFIGLLFFSCAKELSLEGGTGQIGESEWQFNDPDQFYHGVVDTAFRQTVNNLQAAFFQGTSDDGNGSIVLAVARQNLGTGTYANQEVFFAYYVNGALVYSLPNPDNRNFQVEVTQMDESGFAGVFSGQVLDSAGQFRSITNGRFSAKFSTSGPGLSTLTVWTPNLCNNTQPMTIIVNGQTETIVEEYWAQPSCAAEGTAVFNLQPGTYELLAVCDGDTARFEIEIAPNACTILELNINSSDSEDFFPLAADSYWVYKDKSNASLTNRKTSLNGTVEIAGKNYTRFVNDLGDTSYYRKEGSEYFQYGLLDYSGNIDLVPEVEYVFLKEEAPTGATWETPEYDAIMSGVNVKLKLKFTVVSRLSDATGVTTIDMKKSLMLWNAATSWTELSSYQAVYRKGIGIFDYTDERRAAEWTLIEYQIR